MKFLRHLTAVMLAVAVIVALGMLWAHGSGGGATVGGTSVGGASVGGASVGGGPTAPPDSGLHLADTGDLIQTCMIEAVLAAVVITVSAVRRRHRRMRRATARL